MPRTPVRTRRLVLLAVAFVVALAAFSFHMLDSVAWSIAHHGTAGTADGTPIHVPVPWTPRGKPNRPNQIRLLRAPWGLGEPNEWAVIETNTPPLSKQSFHTGLERITSQFASGQDALSDYALPPDLAGRFTCTATHVPKFLTWQLSCISADGFWSVNLFAPGRREKDLLPVLRGLRTP